MMHYTISSIEWSNETLAITKNGCGLYVASGDERYRKYSLARSLPEEAV